jgi:hypothetical protein
MTEMESLRVSFTFFLLGFTVVLLLISKFFYKYMIMEKKCTAKTMGVVKGYTWYCVNHVAFLPRVEYEVNGKTYRVTGPTYKGYFTKTISTPLGENKRRSFYEDEKQILHITVTTNSMVSIIRNPMRELYPIGTEIPVYYCEKNPKLAYVLRYCNEKWIFWVLFLSAMATLALAIGIQFSFI